MSVFVNNSEITDAEIGQEMQHHPASSMEHAWQLAAQSLVIRQLLLQQAAGNGLCEDAASVIASEEEKVIDQLLEQEVLVPEADEGTCRRFYENHPNSFTDETTSKRLPFEQAHAQIRDYLHTKAMRIAVAEYIKALSYGADIRGLELDTP